MWAELDVDFNGYLDKSEALMFVKNISECMEDKSRKENFTSEKFQTVFDQFDEDKNGFLEKAEMAVLIKKMFGKKKSEKNMEIAKINTANQEKLANFLGSYASNFTIDLDKLWIKSDTDLNGMLDKEECFKYLSIIKQNCCEERAKNYDEKDFEMLFERFDEDKNGFIEKSEMAIFLKKVFKNKDK